MGCGSRIRRGLGQTVFTPFVLTRHSTLDNHPFHLAGRICSFKEQTEASMSNICYVECCGQYFTTRGESGSHITTTCVYQDLTKGNLLPDRRIECDPRLGQTVFTQASFCCGNPSLGRADACRSRQDPKRSTVPKSMVLRSGKSSHGLSISNPKRRSKSFKSTPSVRPIMCNEIIAN